jgi:hypothetical protein
MQSFNEMTRGERFVQGVLRQKARERARWWLGLPLAALGALGLAALLLRIPGMKPRAQLV